MPNWCSNYIYCKENLLKYILNFDGEVDFSVLIPEPETEQECDKDYIVNEQSHIQIRKSKPWFNWYDWNGANWGTKWNAIDTYKRKSPVEDVYMVCFNTAWCPPGPWIDKLASVGIPFIHYWEEEQGFGAYDTYNNDNLCLSNSWGMLNIDDDEDDYIYEEYHGLTDKVLEEFFKE